MSTAWGWEWQKRRWTHKTQWLFKEKVISWWSPGLHKLHTKKKNKILRLSKNKYYCLKWPLKNMCLKSSLTVQQMSADVTGRLSKGYTYCSPLNFLLNSQNQGTNQTSSLQILPSPSSISLSYISCISMSRQYLLFPFLTRSVPYPPIFFLVLCN